MQTWKKFLPHATIVVLDYKNIGEFLDVRELGLNLFSGKLTLPHIADAIRVALLAKHGGVWLDIDTIILSSDAEKNSSIRRKICCRAESKAADLTERLAKCRPPAQGGFLLQWLPSVLYLRHYR